MIRSLFKKLATACSNFLNTKEEPIQQKRNYRSGRAVEVHRGIKEDFNNGRNNHVMANKLDHAPAGTKLARKAALGTVGIPGGRRGMMPHMRGGRMVIGG